MRLPPASALVWRVLVEMRARPVTKRRGPAHPPEWLLELQGTMGNRGVAAVIGAERSMVRRSRRRFAILVVAAVLVAVALAVWYAAATGHFPAVRG